MLGLDTAACRTDLGQAASGVWPGHLRRALVLWLCVLALMSLILNNLEERIVVHAACFVSALDASWKVPIGHI